MNGLMRGILTLASLAQDDEVIVGLLVIIILKLNAQFSFYHVILGATQRRRSTVITIQ